MTCVQLQAYQRACGSVSGGISELAIFDPFDFMFTQGALTAGVMPAYTAVALRDEATTGKMYAVTFQQDEAEWKYTQSVKGCSVKWDHEFDFQLPDNSNTLTNFQTALDAAGCCCGLGIIFRLNNGKIFVAGEKFVNDATIPRFTIKQDGTSGGSGKLIDDFNGANMVFKGSFTRNLYEFTGTWDTITALM